MSDNKVSDNLNIKQDQTTTKPRVSVIVPAHNAEQYLDQCLNSILNQTEQNIEVLCVDDGSTDSTPDILATASQKDPRVKVITQECAGAGAARNAGLKLACGDYLLFFDADDYMELNMLEVMYDRAEQTCSDVVVCNSRCFEEETNEDIPSDADMGHIDFSQVYSGISLSSCIFTAFIGWPWDKLFRRTFIQKNNLEFQEIESTNDACFVYCALALAQKISFSDKVLAHHRYHPNSISTTRSKYPHNAALAHEAIKKRLENEEVWSHIYIPFLDWGCIHLRWNYCTLEGQGKTIAAKDYANALSELGKFLPLEFSDSRDVFAWSRLYEAQKTDYLQVMLTLSLDVEWWRKQGDKFYPENYRLKCCINDLKEYITGLENHRDELIRERDTLRFERDEAYSTFGYRAWEKVNKLRHR